MLLLSTLLLTGCRKDPVDRPSLVLVTWDTTRADALGVYGGPEGASPVADSLAASGVRFERALAHAPTTLSSHATLFTGVDAHGHRTPRNGYPLDPDLDTLAESLSAVGYDSIAVVAASAVDSGTRIDQGFRLFDDQLDIDKGKRFEARGDDVTRRALARASERRSGQPLFLWVHYYDAHSPYEAPGEYATRFLPQGETPAFTRSDSQLDRIAELHRMGGTTEHDRAWLRGMYQGEVAWQDQQLGELLAGLESQGVLDDAWVVLTADHGEMFFEDASRPIGHGADIDLPVTHVPLIVQGRGPRALNPRSVSEPVGLIDLGTTLLGLCGVEGRLGEGRDLGPLLSGGEVPVASLFLEATRPPRRASKQGRWNNWHVEHAIARDEHLLIRAPWLGDEGTLYALEPAQPERQSPQVQAELEPLLDEWEQAAPSFREDNRDEGVLEALRSLGYFD